MSESSIWKDAWGLPPMRSDRDKFIDQSVARKDYTIEEEGYLNGPVLKHMRLIAYGGRVDVDVERTGTAQVEAINKAEAKRKRKAEQRLKGK